MAGEGLSTRSDKVRNLIPANAIDPSSVLWQQANLAKVVDALTGLVGDKGVFNSLDASCVFDSALQNITTNTRTDLASLSIEATKSGRYIVLAQVCSRPTGGVSQVNYLSLAVNGVYQDLTESYSGGDWGGGVAQSYHYDAIMCGAELEINAGEIITAQGRRSTGTMRCYHRFLAAIRVGDLP